MSPFPRSTNNLLSFCIQTIRQSMDSRSPFMRMAKQEQTYVYKSGTLDMNGKRR